MKNGKLDRRNFLIGSTAGLSGLILPSMAMGSQVLNCSPSSKRLTAAQSATAPENVAPCLVYIFLRGGMDGLSMVAPSRLLDTANYNRYRDARPDVHLSTGLPLGSSKFMLHPLLGNLHQIYNQGKLAVVQGVGSPNGTRSHFDQMNYIESGMPTDVRGLASEGGFMNRILAPQGAAIQAAAVQTSLPKYLVGANPAVALGRGINEFVSLSSPGVSLGYSFSERLVGLYRGLADAAFCSPAAAASTAVERAMTIARDSSSWDGISPLSVYAPSGRRTELASQLREAARLIKGSPGTRVVGIELGGWDHHVNIGVQDGTFATYMEVLNHALASFQRDISALGLGQRVVTVVMSEFGRPLAQNGSLGLDHGRGGAMLVMGDRVRGGVFTRDWDLARLEESRDVRVTIDYRDVLGQIVQNHLGADLSRAFPGYALNNSGVQIF